MKPTQLYYEFIPCCLCFTGILVTGSTILPTGNPNAIAEPIVPAQDGTGTTITVNGNQFNINGGSLSGDGQNLFHSFQEFGLDANQIANFLANPQIQNILGRVTGNNASLINGLIQVSGGDANLFLMNPAGIIFGQNAQLNIGGDFTATTSTGIQFGENQWFHAVGSPDYTTLVGSPSGFAFDTLTPGSIINAGTLDVKEGQNLTILAGGTLNTGQLNAPEGSILVTAVPGSNRVRISQPGQLLSLEFEPPTDDNGQSIPFTPLDLPQLLTGAGVETGVKVGEDGTLTLTDSGIPIPTESGVNIITGNLDTSGETGGEIGIFGTTLGLINANIDASGNAGGGQIFIGGDVQGQGNVPTADLTFIDSASTLNADATQSGNGGQIIVFARDTTRIYGNLSAKGGESQGNGGFVETSGVQFLDITTTPDVTASSGQGGAWLIDPNNIEIVAGSGNTNINNANPFVSTEDTAQLGVELIRAALTGGANVTVTTGTGGTNAEDGNITLSAPLNFEGTGSNNLIFNASNDININADINDSSPGGDSLNLTFTADSDNSGAGNLNISGVTINTGGGNLTGTGNGNTNSQVGVTITGSTINAETGTINLTGIGNGGTSDNSGIAIDSSTLSVSDGEIALTGTGGSWIVNNNNNNDNYGVSLSNGSTLSATGTGNITLNGIGGNAFEENYGIRIASSNISVNGGEISLTGTGGSATDEDNYGIFLDSGSNLAATGLGNITLNGTGGTGTEGNAGIDVNGATLSVLNGNLTLTGTGGTGTGNNNLGMRFRNTSTLNATGTGTITLDGTGGSGGSGTHGIRIGDTGISVVNGDLILNGAGTDGTTNPGIGVFLASNSSLNSTGAGNIEIEATGTSNTVELLLQNSAINANSDVSITADEINVTGTTTVQGNGTLTLQPFTSSLNITIAELPGSSLGIDDDTTSLDLDTDTLATLQDGFSEIVLGTTNNTGEISLASLPTLNDPVRIAGGTTLIGADQDTIWNITGADSGNLDNALFPNGFTFENIENLQGGTANDTFAFLVGGSISGEITDGGGTDTLDYSAFTIDPDVNIENLDLTGIESVIGTTLAPSSTLTGRNVANNWVIDGTANGSINGVTFTDFDNLVGGTDNDNFAVNDGVSFAGSITGLGGTDTLTYSEWTSNPNVNLESLEVNGIEEIAVTTLVSTDTTISGANTNNEWIITETNSGTLNGINFTNFNQLTGGDIADTFTLNGGTVDLIDGGGGDNSLTGDSVENIFNITVDNAGNVSNINGAIAFSNIQTLTGGLQNDTFNLNGGTIESLNGEDGNDTFNLNGGTVTNPIDGGGGDNTLVGDDVVNTWNLTVENGGNLNTTVNFNNIQNLTGGSDTDNFVFSDGITISGAIDGGDDVDTLDYSNYNSPLVIDLKTLALNNVEQIIGTTVGSTLVGNDIDNTWDINGSEAGTLNSDLSFVNFQNLTGGSLGDTFNFNGTGTLSGTVDGGDTDNINTLNYSALTTNITIDLASNTATGIGGINNITAATGGSGNNTLIGSNTASQWTITGGNNNGNIDGTFTFTDFQNLVGGSDSDTFNLDPGGTIESLDGGSGDDTFNLNGGTVTNLIEGGDGINTIVGNDLDNIWTITATNAGNVNDGTTTTSFENIQTLTGGEQNDTFTFSNGGIIESLEGGSGDDSFNLDGGTVNNLVEGGDGINTIVGDNGDTNWNITGTNAGNIEGGATFTEIQTLTAGDGNDTFILDGGGNVASINGGVGNNEIIGDDTISDTIWNITNNNQGNLDNGVETTSFENIQTLTGGSQDDTFNLDAGGTIESLEGGSGDDTFNLNGGTVTNLINGEDGNNTIIGEDTNTIWNITATNEGNIDGVTNFSNIQNLEGGTLDDTFAFEDNSGLTGTITDLGGSNDTINYSAFTNDLEVNLENLGIDGIEQVFGSSDPTVTSTLVGANINNEWAITGTNGGTVDGVQFSSFNQLQGGNADDTFILSETVAFNGNLDGGEEGTNTLNYSNFSSPITLNLETNIATGVSGNINNINRVIGGSGENALTAANIENNWTITGENQGNLNESFTFVSFNQIIGGTEGDTFTLNGGTVDNLDGGEGTNTLIGDNQENTWNLNTNDAGTLNSTNDDGTLNNTNFANIQTLTGGTNSDTFIFSNGVTITGNLDGAEGIDTLNYTLYTDNLTVELTSFNRIETIVGTTNASNSLLVGDNTDTTWNITDTNQGNIDGTISFSNFNQLQGGSEQDTFNFSDGGTIDSLEGGSGDDSFYLNGGTVNDLDGGEGTNQLSGDVENSNTYILTDSNSGTLNGTTNFTSIQTLTGGSTEDNFIFGENITFDGNLQGAAGDLILTGDEIEVIGTISGTGKLIIEPDQDSRAIAIGGVDSNDTSILEITAEKLNAFGDGFTEIIIGSDTGSGLITVDSAGVTFVDPVTLQSPNGSILLNGTLTGTGNASITLNGSTTLNDSITTTNQNITLNGDITLGNAIVLNTDLGAGNITLNGSVNGTQSLTLISGSGQIALNDPLGNLIPLGDLSLTSNGTILSESITANTLTTNGMGTLQLNGEITTTGDQTYNTPILLTNDLTLNTTEGNLQTLNTLDGNQTLTLNGNIITLASNLGGTIPLRNLIITGNQLNTQDIAAATLEANLTQGITTGNIDTSAEDSSGGIITLTSLNDVIQTNNLNSSGTNGGNITLNALIAITTGEIDTSATMGDAGDIILDPLEDIQVAFLNAEGGINGQGGTIDITAGQFFRVTDTFINQNSEITSISTLGGLENGDITIRHGGEGVTPFEVGNSTTNGTTAAITSGGTTLNNQSYLFTTIENNVQIISVDAPLEPIPETPEPPLEPPSTVIDDFNTVDISQSTQDSLGDDILITETSNPLTDLTETILETSSPILELSPDLNIPEIDSPPDTSSLPVSVEIEIPPDTIEVESDLDNSVTLLEPSVILPEVEDVPTTEISEEAVFEETEQQFTQEVEEYFDLPSSPIITLGQTRKKLKTTETILQIKPALIYAVFVPEVVSQEDLTLDQPRQRDDDKLELLVITAEGSMIRRRLNVTRQQAVQVAREFRIHTTNVARPKDYQASAQQLYQWLVEPVRKELKLKRVNHLSFVLDSGLRSIPLAALHDGKTFIIEQYSVGLMPSLSLTNTSYTDLRGSQVLAMGAETFPDQLPLPAVGVELDNIIQDLNRQDDVGAWRGKQLLNENFTLPNLQQLRTESEFQIVHLATHSDFRAGEPQNSYIQLWDRKLTLDKIEELRLNNPFVELLVLSSCRTALGDQDAELGFAGMATNAGVKTVIGSLWSVSDEGTLGLMSGFYGKLKTLTNRAEALRQTQLGMIRGDVRLENGRLVMDEQVVGVVPELRQKGDQRLEHPYYWSAFMLVGSPW